MAEETRTASTKNQIAQVPWGQRDHYKARGGNSGKSSAWSSRCVGSSRCLWFLAITMASGMGQWTLGFVPETVPPAGHSIHIQNHWRSRTGETTCDVGWDKLWKNAKESLFKGGEWFFNFLETSSLFPVKKPQSRGLLPLKCQILLFFSKIMSAIQTSCFHPARSLEEGCIVEVSDKLLILAGCASLLFISSPHVFLPSSNLLLSAKVEQRG